MTINISLTSMDLTAMGKEGVTALVNTCMAFTGTSLGAEIEIPNAPRKTQSSEVVSASEKVCVCEQIPAKPERTAPVPSVPSVAPATTAIAAPVAPTTPAPVPTAAAPTYTVEEMQLACAPLMDANRMGALQAVCAKYGASSLLDIPKEQYGALAADLRALGARL